jgi:hypothetical protein
MMNNLIIEFKIRFYCQPHRKSGKYKIGYLVNIFHAIYKVQFQSINQSIILFILLQFITFKFKFANMTINFKFANMTINLKYNRKVDN